MTLFRYKAIDQSGKKVSGILEVTSINEAKMRLRQQGMMVTELAEKKKQTYRESITGDNLVAFTLQLAQLLGAGVPLYESLVALEEQYRQEKCHRVIIGLCSKIKEGVALSVAMEAYPTSFDKLYRAMIAAGEAVGALGLVLDKLSFLLKRRMELKGQLRAAMIYPAVLACFSLVVIGILVGFVVPSIENIFEGRELNGFTEAVLGLSRFLRNYWLILIPGLLGITFGLSVWLRSENGKLWLQRTSLKLPFFRTLAVQTALARFCRTMGTLQEGGLSIIDSLRIARETMGNVVLEKVVLQAEEKIVAGSSLGAELAKSELIPSIVSRMLIVGEDASTLVSMLNRVADMYEAEVEKTLNTLLALAQPVILIIMGGVIAVIMLAILLPMADVSSLTS